MTATTLEAAPQATPRSRFYFWIAVAMAATAFLGFTPTFWIPLAQGVPERIAVLAFHGTLFFSWTLFLIFQTWLVSSGHVERHRAVGLIGVSLATAMFIFGVLAAINSAQRASVLNVANANEAALIVPLVAMLMFAVLMIAALANVRRSEWHKRLMLSATAVILGPAFARPFLAYVVMHGHLPPFQGNVGLAGFHNPPAPVVALLPPSLAALLFVVAGMIYDWRTLRKVHPAYLWAGGFALAVILLSIPFSATPLWHNIARQVISLAG